jgi:hypothetical protein
VNVKQPRGQRQATANGALFCVAVVVPFLG